MARKKKHDLIVAIEDLIFDAERVDSSDGAEQEEALDALRESVARARFVVTGWVD